MSNVTTLPRKPRRLGPEPWGSRLTRAREAAGYTLRDLDGARRHLGFGRGPAHALEQRDEAPTEPELRVRAYTLVTFYGFDPADFDLGDDDRPSDVVDLRTLRDLGESPTKW